MLDSESLLKKQKSQIFSLLMVVFIWAKLSEAGYKSVEIEDAETAGFSINAAGFALVDVLDKIRQKHRISIFGLKNRKNETVTLACQEKNLEDLLKCLLRSMNVKNYAFVYDNERLTRLSVFPEAKNNLPLSSSTISDAAREKKTITVLEVHSIIEKSQAKHLGLRTGDLIVEYDGVKVSNVRELVKQTKKKTPYEQVEMVVVRDQIPIRLYLNGGFIGMGVKPKKILKEEFEGIYQ